jgi:hypothetical protein
LPQSRTLRLEVNRASVRASTKPCPAAACIYIANEEGGYFKRSRRVEHKGSVTVYAANATGNVRPYRKIEGSKAGLGLNGHAYGVAVDRRGEIYVLESARVSVFAAAANGNVRPLRSIAGPKTGLPIVQSIAVESNGYIYASLCLRCDSGHLRRHYAISVFAPDANGNVAPIRTISGSNTRMKNVAGIGIDGVGNVYVANIPICSSFPYPHKCRGQNEVLIFAAGANGNVAPIRTISGSKTGLNFPDAVAIDGSGNVYVSQWAPGDVFGVNVYAAGAQGNVAPIQAIAGSKTGVNGPVGIAVDAGHNIYVANVDAANQVYPGSVTVYAAGATGNVAPIQTITGHNTWINFPNGIAIH